MRFLALVACLLAGCDLALGLTEREVDPEGDADGDTLRNNVDNCSERANLDQHDEDRDGVGDVCDNCPHVANLSQDNTDQDTLGEACDDSGAIDCLVRFDPFTSSTAPPASLGTWSIDGGDALVQTDSTVEHGYVVVDPETRDNPLVITRMRVRGLGDPEDYNNAGMWAEASVAEVPTGLPEEGFVAEVGRTTTTLPTDNSKAGVHVTKRADGASAQFVPFSPSQVMTATSTVDLRLDMRGGDSVRSSARMDNGTELVLFSTIAPLRGGAVAFRAFRIAVAFEYLVLIERRNECPDL